MLRNIAAVREGIRKYPLLRKSFAKVHERADQALAEPISVPIPADKKVMRKIIDEDSQDADMVFLSYFLCFRSAEN